MRICRMLEEGSVINSQFGLCIETLGGSERLSTALGRFTSEALPTEFEARTSVLRFSEDKYQFFVILGERFLGVYCALRVE